MTPSIPPEYRGGWRIVDTETWVNDGLDILGFDGMADAEYWGVAT